MGKDPGCRNQDLIQPNKSVFGWKIAEENTQVRQVKLGNDTVTAADRDAVLGGWGWGN